MRRFKNDLYHTVMSSFRRYKESLFDSETKGVIDKISNEKYLPYSLVKYMKLMQNVIDL